MTRETQIRILVSGYQYSREEIVSDANREGMHKLPPVEVGPDWEIWNAPRPLYGHLSWYGPFLSGLLYSAIDPNGDYAEEYREFNRRNDARLLQWVTMEEVIEKVKWYYRDLIEEKEVNMDDFSDGEIIRTYFRVKDKETPYESRRVKDE